MSLLTVAGSLLIANLGGATLAQIPPPQPVRHDVAQSNTGLTGREFLVLRHQRLAPGSHQAFYEASRDGVWPFFEKIGTRVVGQWQVIDPDRARNAGATAVAPVEGYRLARYRSLEHWAATRQSAELGGNGADYEASIAALRARGELLEGSDGPMFLEGEMAPGGPYYMPSLDERYELLDSETEPGSPAVRPVRHQRAATGGREIVTLRSFKIRKGSFDEVYRLSRDGVWPYFEKIGARIVGMWKVVYPEVAARDGAPTGAASRSESADFDEAVMMVRYASYQHWQATRPQVMVALGGDGPDYQACIAALSHRGELTIESSVRFLEGFFYGSPPVYLPALDERYRRVEPQEPDP